MAAVVLAPVIFIPVAFAPDRFKATADQAELISIPSTGVVPEILIASVMLPAVIEIPVVIAVASSNIPVVYVPAPDIDMPVVIV